MVRGARQLLTLRGPSGPRRGTALNNLSIIEDGSLLLANGIIIEAGQTRRIENLASARGAKVIAAEGRVVMPGFVDSHTHLVSGPPAFAQFERHIDAPVPIDASIALGNISAVRSASAASLRIRAARVIQDALRHGTTALESKTGSALDAAGELKLLRVLAAAKNASVDLIPTFFAANTTPPEFAGRPDDYLDFLIGDLLPVVARRKLATIADVCCDSGGFTPAQSARYLEAVKRLGLRTKMQTGQFGQLLGVAQAIESGALSVDRLDHATEEDVDLLAGSATIATLTPAATFHLGVGPYAPARKLIDAGAAVALASGYHRVTCPTANMQMVLALASRELRMMPAETIAAATINGAHALGLGRTLGSLEPGKQADVLILKVGDYRELCYTFGHNLVRTTIKLGRIVAEESQPE